MLSRLAEWLAFACMFARVRWGFRFSSRQQLLTWQQQRLLRWLRVDLARIPAYMALERHDLSCLPITDKEGMLQNFEKMNAFGVTLEQALGTGLQAESSRNFKPTLPGGLTVGLSSGTTGRRGVFLVSPRERQRWAGAMLARVLSSASVARLFNPMSPALRVAFLLRANSNLYTTVQSRQLRFVFCDLLQPWGEQLQQLNNLQPDLLIAPASVLQVLARAQQKAALRICPLQVISVAEVLEPDDAALIQQVWHVPAAQVYQCTEGFLGYTCEAGFLHLNEEWLHIETAWLDAECTRFQPIVTDFSRSAQAFVRYRLDDVLHLAPGPCACGRVSRHLVSIEGRSDDLLWLHDTACGQLQPVFADVLRRAMVLAQGEPALFSDYRIEQRGVLWHIRLNQADPATEAQNRVTSALLRTLEKALLQKPDFQFDPWCDDLPGVKRRRIRCLYRPAKLEPPCKQTHPSGLPGEGLVPGTVRLDRIHEDRACEF